MSERYRLLFRGEVHEGQHPAVVKKRLGQALKLDDERLETLFSGKAVILKRDADPPTAARYQALFKNSGARLRILAVDKPADVPDERRPSADSGSRASLELLPPRSDVLRAEERPGVEPVNVDVSHIGLQGAVFDLPDDVPADEPEGPDVSHLSVADVGAKLSPAGAAPTPSIDVDGVVFEVAEVGTTMDQRPRSAAPPAPDTSHLKIRPADSD